MAFDWSRLKKQVDEFITHESFLLEENINERAITHKLGEYLQAIFSDYSVDCEYNRMPSGDERGFIEKKLDLRIESIDSDDIQWTTVFPDIVVHERWHNNRNLLVVEVKKSDYANRMRAASEESYRDFDKRKISAYMSELRYEYGLYLEFDWKRISEFCIFPSVT